LKFEIRYPDKPPDEVDVPGPVVVIGRDPSADLVLQDVKCSRRHAVVEDTNDGLVVRDTASANGVYVNGKRIEKSPLRNGDVVRIGEVQLTLLSDAPGTMAMEAYEIEEIEKHAPAPGPTVEAPPLDLPPPRRPAPPPAQAPRPAPREAPRPRAVPSPSRPLPRPRPAPERPADTAGASPALLTLSSLWALNAPFSILAAVGLGWWQGLRGGPLVAAIAAGAVVGGMSAVLSLGLWNRRPWARGLQIVLAVLALPTCAFTLAGVAILAYLLGPAGRAQFAVPREEPSDNEPAFAATIVAAAGLGLLLSVGLGYVLARTVFPGGPPEAERKAIERLQKVARAEREYQAGTCPGVFGDLEALLRPSSAIPSYPAHGPAFLGPDFEAPDAYGYRFQMTTAEPVPECPSRAFRRYAYSAAPQRGEGRYLLVGPDGVVRAAEGRPARPDDPPAR
jgi:hypothetical protein